MSETSRDIFVPEGYFDDPSVRLKFGAVVLANELALEEPHGPRVESLRRFVDMAKAEVQTLEVRHREAVADSEYPEVES